MGLSHHMCWGIRTAPDLDGREVQRHSKGLSLLTKHLQQVQQSIPSSTWGITHI